VLAVLLQAVHEKLWVYTSNLKIRIILQGTVC